MKQTIIIGIGFLAVASLVALSYIQFLIQKETNRSPSKNADYLLILGAKVKDKTPSLSLQYRIETAATYLQNNQKTVAIVSGGTGAEATISEGEAIKRGLLSLGIAQNRILIEDVSTNTYENILFSKNLLTPMMKKGIVVSSDYHVYRAKKVCKKQQLDVEVLPAPTPTVSKLKSYLRESFAILKYKLKGYI